MIGGQTYTVQVAVNGTVASYSVTVPGAVLGASTGPTVTVAGPVDQSRIDLMASEVQLMQQLISILQGKLGL
jgi:hypothetical protein